MKRSMVLVGLVLALLVVAPHLALAANPGVHYFDCKQCHKAGATVATLGGTNVCLQCHQTGTWEDSTPAPAPGMDGITDGLFSALDSSNLFGSNTESGTKTGKSHAWGTSDTNLAAGAQAPDRTLYAGFYSRYNSSLGKVTCTRCHNPHGEADMGTGNPLGNPKLVIRDATLAGVPMAQDKMCQGCHVDFNKPVGSPYNTHPMVADYNAVQTAKASQYKTAAEVAGAAGASKAQLVNGGVGCTSCHGVHYSDSDSSTADGVANRLFLNNSDGELLRSDGPLRWGTSRNGAAGTAQLRSNLCQTCHTYKLHGKGQSGDAQIGCLECHNAHDYNNANPFGLRDGNSLTPLPTRIDTVTQTPSTVVLGDYATGAFARSKWSDNQEGTATGYCERCHGDVEDTGTNGIGLIELEHQVGGINPCTACHKHNDPASVHSFNIDANASTCGQCHGFPPYKDQPGDRDTGGTDGGYARNEVDGTPYDYLGRSYYKNETQTGHKTHAGADLPGNPGTWYYVGSGSGIENCWPCHGNNAGQAGGGHRINPTTDPDTFRNINFNSYAKLVDKYNPTYNVTTAKCSAVYCHSNGAPRTGDASRNYLVWATTPAWVGNGTTDGFTSIQGKGTRCQTCHGNDATSMGVAQKNNSQRHIAHLNKGYTCDVCHVEVASSNTALLASAYDGRAGGEHINMVADVHYKTSGSALFTALGVNVTGPTYNTSTGGCAIYCHDPDDTGKTADWDTPGPLACDACHGGKATDATPISSGSHPRHVTDVNGPRLTCDKCHYANDGTHGGHLNGTDNVAGTDYNAATCTTCHAVDGGETVPEWGNAPTSKCVTCHTGSVTTAAAAIWATSDAAPAKASALTTGHGKTSGTYSVSNLTAANQDCEACHDRNAVGHFDSDNLDKRLTGGFDCANCHNGGTAVAVKTHSNTDPTYTGQKRADFTKVCLACHDPHGSSNITMIASTKTDFGGTVTFLTWGTSGTPTANDNSFDESGDASNLDDICATCHTTVAHNNRTQTGTHNEGKTCTACHSHNGTYGGFMPTGGNACNDCHGNPPATGAHARHTTVTTHDVGEDRSDCAVCHPGADTYTMAPGGSHQNAAVNLAAGMAGGTTGCTSACHVATASDGFWTDATGLNCDSCHYYAASPVSGNNLSNTHDEHFAKGKTCSACHTMTGDYNSGTSHVGPLTHINDQSGANEGAKFTGMATALQDEAGFDEGAGVRDVIRSGMTYTDANTCSGGIGIGCHATGAPDWDLTIPNDATGCASCHTDTTTSAVNPTSALHSATPTVSGKKHSTGFTYNGGANTADCATCHTTAPTVTGTDHMNGVLDASIGSVAAPQKITLVAGLGFTDAVTPTCSVSITGCHSAGTAWQYKWHTNAAQTNGTQCDGCHGMWGGWNSGVINHRSGSEAETVHGTGATYKCKDCHGLESASGYPFTTTSNDWKPTELGTTLHGDGQININTAGTSGYTRGTYGGCTGCHVNNDGTAAGQHAFTITSWTLTTITSDAITSSCSSCHGGATAGVSKSNYWPDGANTLGDNGTADNSGEHAVHMAKLALKVYGETVTGAADNDLLRDNTTLNPGLTSDAKQKELCSYCHRTPIGGDADHGVTYPADVTTMFNLWNKGADDAVYTPASGNCANVNCHNNKSTSTTYDWYDGSASSCVMCHSDVTAETTHTAHTAAGMGMTITCDSCHRTASETITWGTAGTAPTTGHIDGSFSVTSNQVSFTYSGYTYPSVKGTCGTNQCHYSGRYVSGARQAPKTASYTWGTTTISGCDACHETTNVLNSGSHTAHLTTTSQTINCGSCHTAGTVATHIDGNVNFTGAAASYNASLPEPTTDETNSTCGTNLCHNNGKNAAPYNNGGGSYTWGTAIGGVNSCTECHNNAALGELHSNHTGAATLFGINTITCDSCHGAGGAAGTHSGHVEGTVALVAGLNYSGTPNSVNVTLSTFGTCNTTTCHSNGLGSAVLTPAWNDASSTGDDCTLCHGNAGANLTSKAHPTHIATAAQSGKAWGPYPTTGSTNCGECHAAPGNNSSMATYTTHIDGTTSFVGGTLAATAVCNSCHGGATPAATAKSNWTTTPTRVTCESCHGDFTLASIGGRTAPNNAGANYDTYGHNKVTNNPTYGGKACTDCHDNTAAGHIDGDQLDKRMKLVNGQTYAAANNTFCASACHGGSAENAHYSNATTPGNGSDDGIYCMTCHNPHGTGLQDAMIRDQIAGRTVSGFTNKTQRSSYANASFNGVCQVCHDGLEVNYFNRSTFLSSHQGGVDVCTSCHDHSAATAFSPSGGGCDGCHGYPPVQRTGVGTAAELYTYASTEDYPGGGRAHAVVGHINPVGLDPADGWTPCAPCHDVNDHNMGYGVGNLQTARDNSGNWGTVSDISNRFPKVRVSTTYNKWGTAFYSMGARDTTAGMGKCNNTACHFSESPKWDCVPADTTNDPQSN